MGLLLRTNFLIVSTVRDCTKILFRSVLSAVTGHPGLDPQEVGYKTGNSALQYSRIATDNVLGNNLSLVILIHDCKARVFMSRNQNEMKLLNEGLG